MSHFTLDTPERLKQLDEACQQPWILLAQQGTDVWNCYMKFLMGDEWWAAMLSNLPESYPKAARKYLEEINAEEPSVPDDNKIRVPMMLSISNTTTDTIWICNYSFKQSVSFRGCVFPYPTVMTDNEFLYGVDFSGAIFNGCNLGHLRFHRKVDFSNVVAIGEFSCFANFKDDVNFENACFSKVAYFNTIFEKDVNFEASQFHGATKFFNSEFRSLAAFGSAVFHKEAWFQSAKFQKASFIGADFKLSLDLRNACFPISPSFVGVKCDAIYLEGAIFKNDLTKEDAEQATSAWAALIRLMEDVHNHDKRQLFHEKLLETEKMFEAKKGVRWIYGLYENIGYGSRLPMPSLIWAVFTVLGLLINWATARGTEAKFADTLAYTLAHSIPFLTTGRSGIENYVEAISDEARTVTLLYGTVQITICTLCLFLIGLALRSWFRVK